MIVKININQNLAKRTVDNNVRFLILFYLNNIIYKNIKIIKGGRGI